jgi:HAD superfamily hydrolase (TIGR01509 family)
LISRPSLVLFDCDGVLVDSETISNNLLRASLAEHGLDLDLQQINALFVGGTLRSAGEQARRMGARLPADWVADFYAVMVAALAAGTPMIDGVDVVFDALDAEGIDYRVCSNGPVDKMETTLGQHPALWLRLHDKVFSGHTHGTFKPEPNLLLLAARDAGHAPSDTVMIDDSTAGCIAARRADMRCFGFAAHDDGARLAAEGAHVFHKMADLPGLLGI